MPERRLPAAAITPMLTLFIILIISRRFAAAAAAYAICFDAMLVISMPLPPLITLDAMRCHAAATASAMLSLMPPCHASYYCHIIFTLISCFLRRFCLRRATANHAACHLPSMRRGVRSSSSVAKRVQ